MALAAGLAPVAASASTVVVPDAFSSVQSAIDSGADTVLIRTGEYPERPLVSRPVVVLGLGPEGRPRLAGMDITNLNFDVFPRRALHVSQVNFTGRVDHATVAISPRGIVIELSACSLQAGFYQTQSGDAYDVATLEIRDCYLGGISSARVDRLIMEADTVSVGTVGTAMSPRPGTFSMPLPPPGAASWSLSIASVRRCVFRGGGLTLSGNPWARVTANRMENCASGITLLDAAYAVVDSNVVAGCGVGIFVTGQAADITDNTIAQCGIGIYSGRSPSLWIRGNRITNSGRQAVLADGSDPVLIERNAIVNGGSGAGPESGYPDGGIVIGSDISATVQNNTVAGYVGSAILLDRLLDAVVERNIASVNLGWGLRVEGEGAVVLACNDWFGNGSGAVSGVGAGSSDVSVDPLFCNLDSADVRLDSASPLLGDSACGQIGALGAGCGVTPTLLQRFTASRLSEGIRVIWELAAVAPASEVWLERSDGSDGSGPWIRPVTERSVDARAVVELDRGALADRAYWYRLIALEERGVAVIGSPILVPARAPIRSRLTEVGPNPGSGPLRIAFALENTAAIEIAVFDLQGRRVVPLSDGIWPAGEHEVVWDGGARNGQPAPAGVYVVRYAHPGGQDRRAIVRVR